MFNLTAKRLREILSYDPDTGLFTSLIKRGPRCLVGSTVGCVHSEGYIEIMISGYHFKASRLAWLYMTGEWPKHEVDHINQVRHDNRWINLRDVTHTENCANRSGMFAIVEVED